MCAGQLFFYCLNCVPGAIFGCQAAPGPQGSPPSHHCHGATYWGRRKLLPWEEGRCHWFTSKGLFFPVQPSSDHLDKQQLCWHNAQPWQQPHKPFCSAGKAVLHTPFYMHLNTTGVLMQTCALAAVSTPQASEAVSQLWRSCTQALNPCQAHLQLITLTTGTTSHCQALTGSEMEGDSEPPKLVVGRKKILWQPF